MNTNTVAIRVQSISKRFRSVVIPKQATLKEAIVRGTIFSRSSTVRHIQALDDVSFEVRAGGSIGIVGSNGSGKSTLMRLLAGVMSPDEGRIEMSGRVAPLLSLGVGFHPDLTGRENARISGLMLGLHPAEVEARMEATVGFAELGEFIDTPVRMYSTGMYMRLAFAVAIGVDPDVMLLDEVFAVGDASFNDKCRAHMERLRDSGKTMVLVSHDLSVIDSFCDTALWLERGKVIASGSPAEVVRRYRNLAPC